MSEWLTKVINESKEEGKKEGVKQGVAQGENLLGTLMTKLFSLGRDEDAKRCAADPEYRQKLYKEFKLA